MHHVNQSAGHNYQHSGRNQFAPASASSSGMSSDRVASGSSGSSLSGSRGVPVMMRVSPTGVPTYYYYAQHGTSTSSPLTEPSSTSPRSGAHSPVSGSAPHSPNPSHHRQLGHSSSSPFHYHHHHQLHYVPGSSLQSHYNLQIPAAPALQQSHCFASPPATPSPPRTPPPAHPMVQSHGTQYTSAQASTQRQVISPQQQSSRYNARANVASGTSAVAIDNKIEQAMDLVKSHLMFAVREEVEVLKEKIAELMERINQLEFENSILKAHASSETLAQLGGGGAGGGGQALPPTASIQMQVQGQQQAS